MVTNWTHGLAEIGYALSTSYQRQGLMPKALAIVLKDLFKRTTLRRIEAHCAVQNVGSIKVLERLGFHREGLLRDYFMLDGQAERVESIGQVSGIHLEPLTPGQSSEEETVDPENGAAVDPSSDGDPPVSDGTDANIGGDGGLPGA